MMEDYLTSEFQGESLRYSNCFCLVQHEYCEINAETKAKNEFTFYSLYMHLLPWNQYQTAEKLVLKKGWNARNSVPHANPDAEQQGADAALPRFALPKDTELEMDSSAPSQKGNVGGKEYDFIKVTIKSKLASSQVKEAEKAGVLVGEGSSVWIANSPDAVGVIKPNLPSWLFDQIEAELLTNMVGRSDPGVDGPTGRPVAGKHSVSLPAGTKLQYDAHQLEFHWMGDKAHKMARCKYVTPSVDAMPGSCGVAWVCVEDKYIKANTRAPSHLGELYVLPSPVAIAAGETIGYLGLVETPGSLMGGKESKHQVHLEVFTQDPRLDDVLANKAGTKGGTVYAKVPAELLLYEKKKQDGKEQWLATGGKSLEELVESPKIKKDAAKQEWVGISSGKYVKKEQVELLSQHDWLKIGFKKVDGSGSDGYLDPEAPPAFFTDLVNSFDTDKSGELDSKVIQAALQNSGNREQLNKFIVKHPSEWYEKSSASSYLWLDKLMAKIGLPDFDKLVDHEKQRIDKLEWMQSTAKLRLDKEVWHIYPLSILQKNVHSLSITYEQLRSIFPGASKTKLDIVLDEVNSNLERFKLNTRTRQRHFFSQIRGEVGVTMEGRTESWEYSPAVLRSFSSYYRANPQESEVDGYKKDSKGKIIRRADQQAIGRKHFQKLNGNRSSNPNDGFNFRGRGLIQITGYEKYNGFKSEYSSYWSGDVPDAVEQPNVINVMPTAIRSALWFWFKYKVYLSDNNNGFSDVPSVTRRVNGGSVGLDERKEAYKIIETILK
ncbi:glycoside hydrolase family 19 protein [Aeromonas sp. NJAU223]|uniref:glycoside hydrolase family 19 protein n=1 Tax=Aeromonas sp. NJAU223 TaxID=3115650 RepID=UPI003DAA077E